MQETDRYIHKGDSVRIKSGVTDIESGVALQGWQGRILELFEDDDGNLLSYIRWDSQTIEKMPLDFINYCLKKDLEWLEIVIGIENIEPAEPRDSVDEAEWARVRMLAKYTWSNLGNPGRQIWKILLDGEKAGCLSILGIWEKHLRTCLDFPFHASLIREESYPQESTVQVMVLDLCGYDETYGVVCLVKTPEKEIILPLIDINIPPGAKNQPCLDLYYLWFSHR